MAVRSIERGCALFLAALLLLTSGPATAALARSPGASHPPPADPLRAPRPSPREASSGPAPPSSVGPPPGAPVDGSVGAGAVGTGEFPYGAAYNPENGELYIANQEQDNVTVLNASSGRHVTDIRLSGDPLGAVYSPVSGLVYLLVESTATLAVVDPATNTVEANVSLAGDPEYGEYDPDNGQIYLSEWASEVKPLGVQAFDSSNGTIVATLESGFDGPWGIAVDTDNDTVWVENQGNNTLTVVSGTNDTVVGWITPGVHGLDGGIAYSPILDQMVLDNYDASSTTSGSVDILSAANGALVRTGVPVGAQAYGGASITYDPVSERIYVASYYADNVTVLSAWNDSIAAPAIHLADGPWVGICDTGTGTIFFLLSSGDRAGWIFGGVAVDFTEVGLPAGTAWKITANGSTQNGTGPTISFAEPVGTAPYSVGVVPGFVAGDRSGNFTVPSTSASPVPVLVPFSLPSYPVDFREQGLALGTLWGVDLSGSSYAARNNGSAGQPIGFDVPNGTYHYLVGSVPGYDRLPAGGTVIVAGRPQNVTIDFQVVTYRVSFHETGLPVGWAWFVNLTFANQSVADFPSSAGFDNLSEPNGTYSFNVSAPWEPGYALLPTPTGSGRITIDGGGVNESVTFHSFPKTCADCPAVLGRAANPGPVLLLILGATAAALGVAVAVVRWRRRR